MCKTKKAVDAVQPKPQTSRHRKPTKHPSNNHPSSSFSISPSASASNTKANHHHTPPTTTTTTSSSTSHSSHTSLSSLRGSLPENPHLYDISELRKATNNFLSNYKSNTPHSSSTRCWRCILRTKDVIIFQRKSHNINSINQHTIREKISSICKTHHVAIINLIGASFSGEYIYLVYEFISNGSNLSNLIINKNNPKFTLLDTWMSRMQVAADISNGINYIHNDAGLRGNYVHNHIKSSSVIVTEPYFNAKICHFGTSELCGEPIENNDSGNRVGEMIESVVDDGVKASSSLGLLTRANSVKFNGTTGYMSPEFQMTGVGTQKCDVYAFGVVLVELLCGEEPVKYKYNKATKEYMKISAVDAAKAVVYEESGGEKEGRLRKWIDRRLKDSYPIEVAYKMTKLAVDCVHVDPYKRPDMQRVAGKISKLYLDSQSWCDKMKIPTDFTVSFAPR